MRLIDADELKRLILCERDKISLELPAERYGFGVPRRNYHGASMRGGIRKALHCMEQCPTIDTVPVVRCKDCRDYKQNPYSEGNEKLCMCWADWIPTEPDDFCSYGERKADGETTIHT